MSVEHHDSGVSTGVVLGIILALLVALIVLWALVGPGFAGTAGNADQDQGPTININPGNGGSTAPGGNTAPAPGGNTAPGGQSGSGGGNQ